MPRLGEAFRIGALCAVTREEVEEARRQRADLVERARRIDLVAYASKLVEWSKEKTGGDDYWACCPIKAERSPSFHVHRKGWFKCFGCDAKGGDAIALCMLVENVSFVAAVEMLVGENLPEQKQVLTPGPRKEFDPDKRAAAKALWDAAKPIEGTLAETYLRARGIKRDLAGVDLRFHPAASVTAYTPHRGDKHPAMIGAIRKPDGSFIGAHVTYLAADGRAKANVSPARKVYGNQDGGAIYLAPVSERMVLGEGVESALSAGEITGRAPIAAVCSGNMKKMTPIDGVDDWLVAYDRDANQTGLKAGQAFVRRATEAGKAARAFPPPADVKDWNDAAQRRA